MRINHLKTKESSTAIFVFPCRYHKTEQVFLLQTNSLIKPELFCWRVAHSKPEFSTAYRNGKDHPGSHTTDKLATVWRLWVKSFYQLFQEQQGKLIRGFWIWILFVFVSIVCNSLSSNKLLCRQEDQRGGSRDNWNLRLLELEEKQAWERRDFDT